MNGTRREFLQTAAVGGLAGVSGCGQLLGDSVRTPVVTVADTTVPAELRDSFEFTVEVLEPFSAAHPARIRAELRHVASADAPRQIAFGATPPFSNYVGSRVDTYDMLLAIPEATDRIEKIGRPMPVEEWVPDEPGEGCWRAPTVPRHDEMDALVVRLSPGEAIAETYTLLGFGQEDCLPSGTYEFVSYEPYKVSYRGDREWRNRGEQRWALGFTLELADA